MSPEKFKESHLTFIKETELTLGLPGESRKSGVKRRRSDNSSIDFSLGGSSLTTEHQTKVDKISTATKPPAKAQVVGWPPVRSYRKNIMKSAKFVKVAVDGAPYLRKVDLVAFHSYQQLLTSLEDMFTCLTICNVLNGKKLMDTSDGTEYVPTYEDKDGDWMLVGDVPWKMFVESCKRLRLMKSSDVVGLAPTTPSKCSRTS
ncbi:PREDICTED: auxin-responsive protein IAA1-like isoform X2 [Ipomoea nil]|uniref:auxin-responsive protein IAA1-like isoform X2 n=1 Tax=Ipomoea nil TaxID=35883 RepID=UPI000901FF57|nr:PREDICTED: auxin-responsive protein IAA1-like isoform X2 [Ipomoea nil]